MPSQGQWTKYVCQLALFSDHDKIRSIEGRYTCICMQHLLLTLALDFQALGAKEKSV